MSDRLAFTRRAAITSLGAAAVAASTRAAGADEPLGEYRIQNGRINQSICSWCYKPLKLEDLVAVANSVGYKSIELLGPEHFTLLKKHGLVCAMTGSHGFAKGFADPAQHAECLEKLTVSIDASADAGFPNVITFSGITKTISKDEGQKNCVVGLKKIVGHAEKKGVTLCFEMLNTRVDVEMKGHPGYLADDIDWTVEICKKVGSPRLKVLFNVYHVQIMHGDVIARINQHKEYIGHYHTAGNPGRQDLDADQELNYPAIMRAIAATGYKGYVGQEFIPKADPRAALAAAARTCDV